MAVDRSGERESGSRKHDHRHADGAVRGRDDRSELLVPNSHRDARARVGEKGRNGSGTQPHRQGPAQDQRIMREIGDHNRRVRKTGRRQDKAGRKLGRSLAHQVLHPARATQDSREGQRRCERTGGHDAELSFVVDPKHGRQFCQRQGHRRGQGGRLGESLARSRLTGRALSTGCRGNDRAQSGPIV